MLRCCRSGDNGADGLSGGYGGDYRRRGSRWSSGGGGGSKRGGNSSAAADDRRQMYRRVSGRTTSSSVELAAPSVHATAPSAGLADCWRRALSGRSAGGCSGATGDTGAGRRRDDESSGSGGADLGRGPVAQVTATTTLSSNWTMISNSSLKDVDGDDLRDELVGYDDDDDDKHGTAVGGG